MLHIHRTAHLHDFPRTSLQSYTATRLQSYTPTIQQTIQQDKGVPETAPRRKASRCYPFYLYRSFDDSPPLRQLLVSGNNGEHSLNSEGDARYLMPSASCGLQLLYQSTVASAGIAPSTAAYSVG